MLDVLPKRFGKYGLTLHPEKTRLVDFRRPSFRPGRGDSQGRKPGSFDFLGFTHHWGRSRQGRPVGQRRTARRRFTRSLKRIGDWLRRHVHAPVVVQHHRLCQSLRGHFASFGITGNAWALARFREAVLGVWRKWLARRRRGGWLSWEAFRSFRTRFPLPPARVVHSVYRPVANPRRDEPDALMGHVRICGRRRGKPRRRPGRFSPTTPLLSLYQQTGGREPRG